MVEAICNCGKKCWVADIDAEFDSKFGIMRGICEECEEALEALYDGEGNDLINGDYELFYNLK